MPPRDTFPSLVYYERTIVLSVLRVDREVASFLYQNFINSHTMRIFCELIQC